MARGDHADSPPKLVDGLDLRTLPIGPEEAFVLSRVDGRSRRSEIALATGIDPTRVNEILDRLIELGAISFPGEASVRAPTPAPEASTRPQPVPSVQPRPAPVTPAVTPATIQVVAASMTPRVPVVFDQAELDEAVDLTPDRKRQVLALYHELERLTHYEILGVSPSAEKQAIKTAYFELVAVVHPDRYFGKNLGSYKQKLEKLFERVTLAHDTLAKKKSRAEYDDYLKSRQATRAFERAGQTMMSEEDLAAIERQIREEALRAATEESEPRVPAPAARPSPAVPNPWTAKSIAPEISRPPLSADERRKSLARKLGISSEKQRLSQPAMTVPPEALREAAAEDLKRRYETRVALATEERLQRYIQQADEAEAAKNFVAAANALRVARSLAPDDEGLAARFERVERASDSSLSRQYLEQAQYEERTGKFADAAQHYERASRGARSSPNLLERAAHCHLEANGDLRHASDLAKKAVELAPKQASCRITLARIYAQAGMTQSAMAELERARTLDPGNDTVKDWIKRLKRSPS